MKMTKKLIKLSEEHYVIVDEGKEIIPSFPSNGHWCYVLHKPSNTILEVNLIGEQMGSMTVIDETPWRKREVLYKEVVPIIAATMEFHPKESMKLISLSEVEEAIYGYSVEKILDKLLIERGEHPDRVRNAVYYEERELAKNLLYAHKELVKDKLFTIEDMEAACAFGVALGKNKSELSYTEEFKGFIKDFYKTEWKVEFDEQGKLKLS